MYTRGTSPLPKSQSSSSLPTHAHAEVPPHYQSIVPTDTPHPLMGHTWGTSYNGLTCPSHLRKCWGGAYLCLKSNSKWCKARDVHRTRYFYESDRSTRIVMNIQCYGTQLLKNGQFCHKPGHTQGDLLPTTQIEY